MRNRAKELVELLADVDKIRQERKKAKANRSKYVGTGNDGFSFGGGGRYGGFGSESSGGGYNGDYGGSASGYDRGGLLSLLHKNIPHGQSTEYSAGGSSSGFRDAAPKTTEFEEYDAGDYETSPRRTTTTGTTTPTAQSRSARPSTTHSKVAGKAPEPAPAPVMNLLDLNDEPGPVAGGSATMSTAAATDKALPALGPLVANDNGTPLFLVVDVNTLTDR